GVKFHHELLVAEHFDLLTFRKTVDGAGLVVAVNAHPVRNHHALGQIQEAIDQLLGTRAVFHADHVTRLALIAGNVHHFAIHSDVAVANHLTGSETGVGKAKTINDVIQTGLKQLQEDGAGHAFTAGGFSKQTTE